MSTVHEDPAVSEREDRKPEMILYYNRTKGGVDNLDKVFAALLLIFYQNKYIL